jgi:hypothetical protein
MLSGDVSRIFKGWKYITASLAEIAEIRVGITPYRHSTGHSRELIESRAFHAMYRKDKTFKPLLNGSHVSRYRCAWEDGEWISYGTWLADAGDQRLFESRRLVAKQMIDWTTRRIHAAISEPGYYNTQTIFNILPREPYDLGYMLALLNSNLINAYHRTMFLDQQKIRFQKFLIQDAKQLPIRVIDFVTPGVDRQRYLETIERLYEQGSFAAVYDLMAENIESQRTDAVHDSLAFLAEQMIALNRVVGSETKQFLEYLKGKLRIIPSDNKSGIQVLSAHTIIQNYLGDYQKGEPELPWAEMAYRLYQNRSRFAANWESVKGEVQAEYEQSLATLRPIKQRLAETDALIDKIVYRLYGLTEEEVRLIEQPAYEHALTAARTQVAADKKLQGDPDAAADAVAAKVLPAAQRLLQRVEHAAERAALDAALPGWELYPDPVPTFLLTGEYNIQQLPDHLDFAASVVSYAKAVETMLFHRLFLPFRDEAGVSPDDARNSFLRQFLAGERDKLTLGSMQIILASSKETALRAFAAARFYDAPTRLFGPEGVAALLADDTAVALRNAAAHDQLMTRADAQAARAWAVGILEKL